MNQVLLKFLFLLFFIISASFVNAQSTDRDNPTPIIANKASAFFDVSNTDKGFYHSFVANPGELKIIFSLEAGKRTVNQIELDVYDENARKIATKNITSGLGRTEQSILRINIENRQTILLRITILHANGEGQYRLQLEGTVARNENTSSSKIFYFPDTPSNKVSTGIDFSNIAQPLTLPQKGQLKILMKDGSIIVIDLSEVKSNIVKNTPN
ncbi:MAG: hypothetical protein ACKVQW_01175 [Pyrinomonadaceae bacterium]